MRNAVIRSATFGNTLYELGVRRIFPAHHLEKRVAALEALHRVRPPVRVLPQVLEEVVVPRVLARVPVVRQISGAYGGPKWIHRQSSSIAEILRTVLTSQRPHSRLYQDEM